MCTAFEVHFYGPPYICYIVIVLSVNLFEIVQWISVSEANIATACMYTQHRFKFTAESPGSPATAQLSCHLSYSSPVSCRAPTVLQVFKY